MNNILTAFVLFGLSVRASVSAADAPEPAACVYQYKGAVEVLQPGDAEWLTLRSAVPIREGARLKTGPGASCQVLAADGTFINIYENSETVIEKLAVGKDLRDFGFNFLKGRILWMVSKLKRKASRFEIRTPSAVCAVRGTDFAIDVSSSAADIGLFEGELDVRSGGKETVLPAGSEAVVAGPGAETAVNARLSRLMLAEQRRYLRLKKHVEDLRAKLDAREGFIDEFVKVQQRKLQEYDNRRKEKLEKRK